MNLALKALLNASSRPRRILGLMSGTSLDGLDLALCRIEGFGTETQVVLEHFTTIVYTDEYHKRVRAVFAKDLVQLPLLTLLNAWIGREHGRMINETLADWGVDKSEVDLVASHGQTVMHTPWHQHRLADFPHHATLQLGDGDHIAQITDLPVLSDFRQKHIAAGGEGAPLALYGDYLLFSSTDENRILLNLGGIANLTFLPASSITAQVVSTDCGPANTLLDRVVRKHFEGMQYDQHGRLAATGLVNQTLLVVLQSHPFFDFPLPKTTGPEVFNESYLQDALEAADCMDISPADLLATLCSLTAYGVARVVSSLDAVDLVIYLSGGGQHNRTIVAMLQSALPHCNIHPLDKLGIKGDAKEAILFAVLANEWLSGQPIAWHESIGPAVSMGKLSLPG
jgi:anhydro-N-acetylmuramic acid kinase